MGLDKELLRMDSLGIFPLKYESQDEYMDRGQRTITGFHVTDMYRYASIHVKRQGHDYKLYKFDNDGIKKRALDYIDRRFDCDLSWLKVYYAKLDWNIGGLMFHSKMQYDCGQLSFVAPPFVLIDASWASQDYSTLCHEIVHAARDPFFYHIAKKHRKLSESYEEKIAEYGSGKFFSALSYLHIYPKTQLMFNSARRKIKQSFGHDTDYVLIRTSFPEVFEYYSDKSCRADAKRIICIRAEQGNLRNKIIKEKLRV